MSVVLQPAVSLMNKLTYPKKMAFISIVFLVPLIIVSYLLMNSLTRSISSTDKEARGLEFVKIVRQIYQHFPQHRGMTNAYLNGASEFKDKILAKRTEIQSDIKRIDEVNSRYGDEFATHELWSNIKADWRKLEQGAFEGPAATVFSDHSKLIVKVYSLFELVSNESGMVLDPELNTFFLMDAIVYRIPNVTENFGKSRGMGSGIAAKGNVSLKGRVELGMMMANIATNLATVNEDMRIAFEENPGLKEKVGSLNDASSRASSEFSKLINDKILQSEIINIDANVVFSAGTDAIKANYALYDALVPVLGELFLERSKGLTETRNLLLLMIVVGISIAIYLFAGFYYSVVGAITSLDKSVNLIAKAI